MLKVENARIVFHPGTVNETEALRGISLHLSPGEFPIVFPVSVTTLSCEDSIAIDYDGSNNMTPWGASIENIHVADTALLAINNQIDMEYSFLLVPVYKTITTSEWYDMDANANVTKTWENVIGYCKFTDVTVHPDGSVTYNESYVELNGNYTDSNAADTIYLNQLRSTYSFIEVPMP